MIATSTESSSFGTLLKAFRQRQHLTQARLAERLGVHRHAIGRWEVGDVLPASKTIVLELARHLLLDDQESRQLLEASLTAPAPHWSVPLPRNPFFTGREETLKTLHRQLSAGQQASTFPQAYALQGLGGVGKTQIALEFAYRHALEYSALFWIEAETVETLILSFLRIAEVLQVPECREADQHRVVAAVQHWLVTHNQWLLIWDNLEELDLLPRFLPAVRQGAILLTTRSQVLGTLARGLDLAPMGQEEGTLLLLRRAKMLEPEATQEQLQQFVTRMPDEYQAASELVSTLGRLPLALDQAAAYLEETGCSAADYVQRYQQMRASLLARRGMVGSEHPHSVAATFLLASKQAEQKHRAAADLLRVCTFLHAEAIPEEMFGAGALHLGPALASLAADPSQLDQALAALRSLSLIHRHPETHTLSMHRLVQTVLQERLNEHQQTMWLRRVSAALNAAFPDVTHDVWGQCERLLPHVFTCATAIPESVGDRGLAQLLQKAASYLRDRAQYDQAEALYQRALRIQEQILEAEHPELVESITGLAFLYAEQGKYAHAEPLYQRALHIRERTLGPADPALASMFHKVAALSDAQGKDEQAERYFKQALAILEQAPEPDRQKMANSLNGLASLYLKQGKYAQAEPLYQQALSIWEQALGLEHPLLTYALNGLASLWSLQEKYEAAEPLYQRALSISERVYGEAHPQVAYILVNQAECYTQQGKYVQAEPLYRRALPIWEQAFGETHPHVAYVLAHQADCYVQQGKYALAEPLYRRALLVREQHLGQDHSETAQTLSDLAVCYQKQQQVRQALSCAKRALAICCQSLGETHPKTAATRMLYTQLLQEQAGGDGKAPAEREAEYRAASRRTRNPSEKTRRAPSNAGTLALQEVDPLQRFLDACCELDPLAWCRIRDLWQTYEHWTASCQGRVPLSRRTFAAQMKARGCRVDRTSTARIWRGIRLVKTSP